MRLGGLAICALAILAALGCDSSNRNQKLPQVGETFEGGKVLKVEKVQPDDGAPIGSLNQYQRFVPVNSEATGAVPSGALALDTKTGQLCRTYDWSISEKPVLLKLPVCQRLFLEDATSTKTQTPPATVRYFANGKTYDIPLNLEAAFLKDHPEAKSESSVVDELVRKYRGK